MCHRPESATLSASDCVACRCSKDPTLAAARDNEIEVLRLLRVELDQAAEGRGSHVARGGHPHVANMLDELGDTSEPHIHAVLEYCAGGTLKRYLQARPSASECLRVPPSASECLRVPPSASECLRVPLS
jgi:hypothetical protein